MSRIRDLHRGWMKDPEYRQAYDALEGAMGGRKGAAFYADTCAAGEGHWYDIAHQLHQASGAAAWGEASTSCQSGHPDSLRQRYAFGGLRPLICL